MNGALIRQRREAKGLSQDELGAAIGRDQAVISRLESGKQTDIRAHYARRLAAILEISIDDLLSDPVPSPPATPVAEPAV